MSFSVILNVTDMNSFQLLLTCVYTSFNTVIGNWLILPTPYWTEVDFRLLLLLLLTSLYAEGLTGIEMTL